MSSGFTPAHAECINIKTLLCDANCAAFDVPIAQQTLSTLGATSLPAGITAQTGALWAQMAYAVTYNATAGTMMQVYPVLESIFECESRNAGLIWANFVGFFKALQTCQSDSGCANAWTNIRTNSTDVTQYVGGSEWDHQTVFEWWVPSLTTNTDDQGCNIFFAALAENNAKALNLVVSSLALLNPDGNSAMEHCNGQGVIDLENSNATNGFIPTTPICAQLKSMLCRDAECQAVDTNTAAQVTGYLGATSLPAGFQTGLGSLWAQMGFVVTYGGTGGAVKSIHPVMNWVYECEAFFTGQSYAEWVGVWKATETCMNDADCVTAWTNIRENSESGNVDAGTVQDKGATWMYIAAADWWVPDSITPGANTEANYCNMAFAAMEEKNAKASYLLSSMTATFTPEYAKQIADYCEDDMTAFVVGIVTEHVIKAIVIFSLVGLTAGSLVTGLGCYCCCNRKSKQISV